MFVFFFSFFWVVHRCVRAPLNFGGGVKLAGASSIDVTLQGAKLTSMVSWTEKTFRADHLRNVDHGLINPSHY